jgi:hypothetical protein
VLHLLALLKASMGVVQYDDEDNDDDDKAVTSNQCCNLKRKDVTMDCGRWNPSLGRLKF